MADTAIKTSEAKKEYFDSEEELEEKIDKLATWILSSEHFISFTGGKHHYLDWFNLLFSWHKHSLWNS